LLKGSPAPEELHAFRLKTKRLRYTLELFRPCYSAALEQRLELLREIQTVLGDLNDCAAAQRIAADTLPANSRRLAQVKRFLRVRGDRLAAAFRKHWKEKFDASGREEWWVSYLAGGKHRALKSKSPIRRRAGSGLATAQRASEVKRPVVAPGTG
jgi:hypothetical protein